MDARHILSRPMCRFDLGDDLIEMKRSGVDDTGTLWRCLDDLFRHQRSGIEADRAALDQLQAPQGDEIGCARSGADEMNAHDCRLLA